MIEKRILLIEKDEHTAAAIRKVLAGSSLMTTWCRRLKQVQENPAASDAIALNAQSVTNTKEAVKLLKQRFGPVPLIVYTGKPRVEEAVCLLKNGADDYISLESEPANIAACLANLVAKPCVINSEKNQNRVQFITRDPGMLSLVKRASKIAPSDATVLIQGESGTGKEVLARYIHLCSGRNKEPFVAVNCAALPEQLAESELFGYEKGAFTGANKTKMGKFEQANNGTLLLDEISEMPLFMQAKLLRALQQKEIDRVGATSPIEVNVRIIATSNRDLKLAVANSQFRKDLYYRLKVIVFNLPALRQRQRDIDLLSDYFLAQMNRRHGRSISRISDDARKILNRYRWPGNIRELENTIQRAVLLDSDDVLAADDIILDEDEALKAHSATEADQLKVGMTVEEMEKALIIKTLEHVNQNRTHAARMLGISIRTLRNKIKAYREANLLNSEVSNFYLGASSKINS